MRVWKLKYYMAYKIRKPLSWFNLSINYIHVKNGYNHLSGYNVTPISSWHSYFYSEWKKCYLNIVIFLELVLGLKITRSCHKGQQEALEKLEKQENYMSRFLYIDAFEYYAANKNYSYENL